MTSWDVCITVLSYLIVFLWGYGSCQLVGHLVAKGAGVDTAKDNDAPENQSKRNWWKASWRDITLICVSLLLIVVSVFGYVSHRADHQCAVALTLRSRAVVAVQDANTLIVNVFNEALKGVDHDKVVADYKSASAKYTEAVNQRDIVFKTYPIASKCS